MENGKVTDSHKINDLINFQIRRQITNLFKNYLDLLEDLQQEYNIPDYIFSKNRKIILDRANNTIREIDDLLSNLNITLK